MTEKKGIVIRDLTLDLRGPAPRRLVAGLSLSVGPGRALALVGESGAGKSLTALAVMGLLPDRVLRSGGDAYIGDRSVNGMTEAERRRFRNREVAMIPQNPMSAFDPVCTIGGHFHETLASHFPGVTAAKSRAAAARVLAEAGLPDPEEALRVYPFQMSGGMLQRVMIALALVTDPSFIIADEPTSDLDPELRERVLDLLNERRRVRGTGLLVITHDLDAAERLGDAVAVMRAGKLVECGPVREVFAAPREAYTRELLAARRELHGEDS